uniref:LOW QUALITY PROTEIN: chitinase-3-like protein 2 n=1 Tax=Crassostrea virginica TaxID=6565 RepID=A0A8B8DAB0_CRAVI|nr:LOW QUALITY PROTEIN: chitinase-3-like protein 2 [Crassostrea virginica]
MADFLSKTIFRVLLWITLTLQIDAGGFKRVCYYTNWSENRAVVESRFHLKEHIDPFLCTHLIYAFKLRIERAYPTEDDRLLPGSGLMFDFTDLKKKNPKLKTILSIGVKSSDAFKVIMGSDKNIKSFAENIHIYINDRNFDGIDINWEYRGSIYKTEFVYFLKELRSVFAAKARDTRSEQKLITIATAAGKHFIESSYDMPEIIKYVDFINVMAYDYFGPWSQVTGFMAPLYSRYSDKNFDHTLSQNWTMNEYVRLGAPPEKLVLGLHGAGSSFTLKSMVNHSVGDAVSAGGKAGPLLKLEGRMAYTEICMMGKDAVVYDKEQQQKFAYRQTLWVGYEDPDTIAKKVQYAVENNFGGVMFWSLDLDDFTGRYCHQGKYPLLSKVKNVSETLAPNTVVDKITTPKVIVTKSTTSETVVSLNTTETLSSKAVDTIKTSVTQGTHQKQSTTTVPTTTTTVWPPRDRGFRLFIIDLLIIIDSRNSTTILSFSGLIILLSLSICFLFLLR